MSEETKKTSEEQEAEKEIPVTDGDQEEENLRISGQSCLYLQAIIELRKFLLILLHDCLTFRTWTYQRHISFEHIE